LPPLPSSPPSARKAEEFCILHFGGKYEKEEETKKENVNENEKTEQRHMRGKWKGKFVC
jgi:hypothetical protein